METKTMAHDIDDDLYFGGGLPDDYEYEGDEYDDYTDEDWLEAESNQAETLYFNS